MITQSLVIKNINLKANKIINIIEKNFDRLSRLVII